MSKKTYVIEVILEIEAPDEAEAQKQAEALRDIVQAQACEHDAQAHVSLHPFRDAMDGVIAYEGLFGEWIARIGDVDKANVQADGKTEAEARANLRAFIDSLGD